MDGSPGSRERGKHDRIELNRSETRVEWQACGARSANTFSPVQSVRQKEIKRGEKKRERESNPLGRHWPGPRFDQTKDGLYFQFLEST